MSYEFAFIWAVNVHIIIIMLTESVLVAASHRERYTYDFDSHIWTMACRGKVHSIMVNRNLRRRRKKKSDFYLWIDFVVCVCGGGGGGGRGVCYSTITFCAKKRSVYLDSQICVLALTLLKNKLIIFMYLLLY